MIALDTNTLIYAVQQVPHASESDLFGRARYLVQELIQKDEKIGVPTPVISELLCVGEERNRRERAELIAKLGFVPLALDLPASMLAARLQAKLDRSLGRPTKKERPRVKHDALILAICEMNQVEALYTADLSDFLPMAAGLRVEVRDIPTPMAPNLPGIPAGPLKPKKPKR